MSYAELVQWRRYAERHGGLPLPRLVYLLAALNTQTNNAHGGTAQLRDFMPAAPAKKEETFEESVDRFLIESAELFGD